MPEDNDDVAESQKLTKKDRREIEQGACVNCAVATFVIMVLAFISLVL